MKIYLVNPDLPGELVDSGEQTRDQAHHRVRRHRLGVGRKARYVRKQYHHAGVLVDEPRLRQ